MANIKEIIEGEHLPVRLDKIDYLRIVYISNYLNYMEHVKSGMSITL